MIEYSDYHDDDSLPFTEEEIRISHKEELDKYAAVHPMTPSEKRALRKWVAAGHGVYDYPGSRYICMNNAYPPGDFLDAYRMGREITQELKGITGAGRGQYADGYADHMDLPEETPWSIAWIQLQEPIQDRMRRLEREAFCLSVFIAQEGLWEESREFLKNNVDDPLPFEMGW